MKTTSQYGETRRVDQQKSKIQIKMKTNGTVRRNPLRDLQEWLEEFTMNLVDHSVPEHRDAPASSSRELRHLHENQNNKGSLQKTQWRSRTSCRKFW